MSEVKWIKLYSGVVYLTGKLRNATEDRYRCTPLLRSAEKESRQKIQRLLVLRAIKSAVLNRFCYVGSSDLLHTRNIGDRARHLEYAVISARR